jgi:hypothetical protein
MGVMTFVVGPATVRKDTAREGVKAMVVVAVSTVGWALLGILFLCIWVALAFWPARVAHRKGHSFLGYFILSLFFFPLALIMAYVVRDRATPAVG